MSKRGSEKIEWTPWANIESAKKGESGGRVHVENLAFLLMDPLERKAYEKVIESELNADLFYGPKGQILSKDYDEVTSILLWHSKNRSDLTPYILGTLMKVSSDDRVIKRNVELSPRIMAGVMGIHESTARKISKIHTWGDYVEVPFDLELFGSKAFVSNPNFFFFFSSTDIRRFKGKKANKSVEAYLQKFEARMFGLDPYVISALEKIKEQVSDRFSMLVSSDLVNKEISTNVETKRSPPKRFHIIGKNLEKAYHMTMPKVSLEKDFPQKMEYLGEELLLSKKTPKRYLLGEWEEDKLKKIDVVDVPFYKHERGFIPGMLIDPKEIRSKIIPELILGHSLKRESLVGKIVGKVDLNDPELPLVLF